jgi:hypothetical protein
MKEHGIKKNENKDLYGNCLEIYSRTIDILNILRIGSDNSDDLKVSYYTKKIIAQSLLIEPKCENECKDFRFYNTHKMNDPSEGKTLLSFLGINKEDLKLPETLPFIGCFTLEVDNLNQFRLYGNDGNKEATGVSIVFKFDFFNEARELYRCIYMDLEKDKIKVAFSEDEEDEEEAKEEDLEDIKDKQQDVKKLLNYLKKSIKKLFDRDIGNIDINRAELAKDLLIRIRYIVKDYAFKEERECRIINLIDKENKEERSKIKIDGERFYINICEVKDYIREIYFAPLAEGMEVFEIETGITCIRSCHPFNSQQDKLHCRDDVCTFAVKFAPLSAP